MTDFYEMNFMEGIVIYSMTIHLLRPGFIKEQASSPCHDFILFFLNKI